MATDIISTLTVIMRAALFCRRFMTITDPLCFSSFEFGFIFDSVYMSKGKSIKTPVHTVPDPHGHDIKLNSFKTSVALKSMIILQNLITTNHRKSGKSKDDLKLTELDVVTMRIRYRACK